MPLYEYRCTQCGYRFEKIQKFQDKPEEACPKCGGELRRPLAAPALQFKGGGWYVNDYAPKASSSSAEKPAPGGAAENKPAAETTPAAESKSTTPEPAPKPSAKADSSGTS